MFLSVAGIFKITNHALLLMPFTSAYTISHRSILPTKLIQWLIPLQVILIMIINQPQ